MAKCLRAQGIGVFFTVKKQKFSTIIYITGNINKKYFFDFFQKGVDLFKWYDILITVERLKQFIN